MADIKNLTVLPRPRSAWQAMDAGFTLARAHYVSLVLMWLGLSAPVFLICFFVQIWLGWGFVLVVWWWCKPLYELPILFYLSKAVFSENLSIKQAWKLTIKHFWALFKTYLTIARLSTRRALSYSVVFLEMLPRKQRSARIQTLTAVKTRHYLLMIVCLHIEYILTYAIIASVALVFFSSSVAEIQWRIFFEAIEDPAVKKWMLSASVTTFISAALVAPFYVSGGFLIYINRRMQLEAWDIEHRFRTIQPRSAKSTALASIILLTITLGASDQTMAQQRSQSIMTPEEAQLAVEEILAHPDFGSTQIKKLPRLKNRDKKEQEDSGKLELGFLEWLADAANSLATIFKVILWATVAIFLGLLLYTVSKFRRNLRAPSPLTRRHADGEDAQSHPMTQDLPADIVAAAERLLASGERRKALSVLFRGALRSVMNEHELKIASGATETDCQKTVASVASEQQTETFTQLLGVWRKEAYANQPQSEQAIKTLIVDWKAAFALNPTVNSGEATP